MIPYPNEFELLNSDERTELRSLIIKLNVWLAYCDNCRGHKQPPNPTKDLSNEEYFRIQELRSKVWGPLRN